MGYAVQVRGVHVLWFGVPHLPGTPPPPQVWPVGHVQLAVTPPQPLLCCPQEPANAAQVIGVHGPPPVLPHLFAVPAPPQTCPVGHEPQFAVSPPQPSPCCPQVPAGKAAHVFGVHVEVGGGGTHDARSKIMYSRIFCCESIAEWSLHSFGNVVLFERVTLLTWKSLKMP